MRYVCVSYAGLADVGALVLRATAAVCILHQLRGVLGSLDSARQG